MFISQALPQQNLPAPSVHPLRYSEIIADQQFAFIGKQLSDWTRPPLPFDKNYPETLKISVTLFSSGKQEVSRVPGSYCASLHSYLIFVTYIPPLSPFCRF